MRAMIYRELKDFVLAREPGPGDAHGPGGERPGESGRESGGGRGAAFFADFGRIAMLAGGAGAWALHSVLPLIALDRGDVHIAQAWAERLLALSRELDFDAGIAHARALLGDLHARQGQYHDAHQCYGHALDLYDQLDDEANVERMLAALADMERADSKPHAAPPEAHSEALEPHTMAGRMARAALVKAGRPIESQARKRWLGPEPTPSREGHEAFESARDPEP